MHWFIYKASHQPVGTVNNYYGRWYFRTKYLQKMPCHWPISVIHSFFFLILCHNTAGNSVILCCIDQVDLSNLCIQKTMQVLLVLLDTVDSSHHSTSRHAVNIVIIGLNNVNAEWFLIFLTSNLDNFPHISLGEWYKWKGIACFCETIQYVNPLMTGDAYIGQWMRFSWFR